MVTVSVVVPTYNRSEVITRTIDSVRKQTYSDIELIIIDDGSTDKTIEVIEDLNEDWIQCYKFDTNRGANAARNKGIELASGEYISFLDSDDELHARHIEVVLNVFNQHDTNQVAGVYTGRENYRNGELVEESSPGDQYITQSDVAGGFTCATFHATVFDEVGRLDENLPALQDLDFFIRVLEDYKIVGLNDVLTTCHLGADRISGNGDRKLKAQERILEKHGETLTDAGVARLYYYTAFGLAQDGDLKGAREHFVRTIQAAPTKWLAYVHYIAAFHPLSFELLLAGKRLTRAYIK